MTKKSQLMDYEWMIKYTPQTAWIEGKGVLLWLAFFFSEMGAGIYFVSIFLNFRAGCLVGWLVALVLGGLVHMAYLGRPTRSWRMLLRPGSSELSRGLWVTLLFALFGFFQVIPILFSSLPWTGDSTALKIIMGILSILLMTHGFLTMYVVKALPMWNSSMMMPLSLISGIWVGSQTVELLLFLGGREILLAEVWSRWSLLGYMAILLMFVWGSLHASDAAHESIKGILTGDSSLHFYIGVIAVGILIPLLITLKLWGSGVEKTGVGILFLRFICVMIGDLMMRFKIMKSAIYSPII